jgi:hypothetical protein
MAAVSFLLIETQSRAPAGRPDATPDAAALDAGRGASDAASADSE